MILSARSIQSFILIAGPSIAIMGIARLLPEIEPAAIKTAIALTIGPLAGIGLHRACIPNDHLPPTSEAKFEKWRTALATDAAHWRRTVLVAAATLTIGLTLALS